MQNKEHTYRLFFALWPSAAVRQSIADVRSSLPPQVKGRAMQLHNLHITLHFIGQVTAPVKDCLDAAAQSVTTDAFRLKLDNLGHFRKAKILWIGCRDVPDELLQLHGKLAAAIEPCGYLPEKRPFAPHITLLRKCFTPPPADLDVTIPWQVDHFVLVESVTHQEGVEYRIIGKYGLS